MAYTGGGGAKVKYGNPFFCWLDNQILMIEDYAYAGNKFWGDPDLPLLASAQWGDIGKKQAQYVDYFCIFMFYDFMNDDET